MIVRVEDAQGNVLHDCVQLGCDVSWDGYRIADQTPVEGRTNPDPAVWKLDGPVARLTPQT